MIAYHVVTERPMQVGQVILFDEQHHSGVFERVYEKLPLVEDVYKHPENYDLPLEHHLSVALRELAIEEVRQQHYPQYPSRLSCLYVSRSLEEAKEWAKFFISLNRPTYAIVKLNVEGNYFLGNANLCFKGTMNKEENLKFADLYWNGNPDEGICEMLVDGKITVVEIIETFK